MPLYSGPSGDILYTDFADILSYFSSPRQSEDIEAEFCIFFQKTPLVFGQATLQYYFYNSDRKKYFYRTTGLKTKLAHPISLWSPKFTENAGPGTLESYASVEIDITPAIFASTITLDGGNTLNVTANLTITGHVEGLDTRSRFPLGIFANKLVCVVPAPFHAIIVIALKNL